jgi:hypothetical protein
VSVCANRMRTARADDSRSYTAFWNFTFATSSDPSQANDTYCGPGPFSFESYVVNETFSVNATTSGQQPDATVTTDLPQQPTGLVKSSADRSEFGWWSSVLGLAAVGMLL